MLNVTAKAEPPDFYNLIARERGLPEAWRWYELRVLPEHKAGRPLTPRDQSFVLVRGAVCSTIYRSGPRKGQTNWHKRDKSTEIEFVIAVTDFDARIARWEAETGSCRACGGTGQAVRSCGAGGTTYRACTRCDANQLEMFR
jgi:hypothetical protein